MCNAMLMCFGVGQPSTAWKTSWARLRTWSYCLGLTGHHHPPQGRHPLWAMPCGWTYCSSFSLMPQRMIPSSQDVDTYDLTLSTPWVSRDFLKAFLKTITKNMAQFLRRWSSRHDINCVVTALHGLVWVLGHAFSCEWTHIVRQAFMQTQWYWK